MDTAADDSRRALEASSARNVGVTGAPLVSSDPRGPSIQNVVCRSSVGQSHGASPADIIGIIWVIARGLTTLAKYSCLACISAREVAAARRCSAARENSHP